ncbi:unnamed protein product [Sphagnum balticum]
MLQVDYHLPSTSTLLYPNDPLVGRQTYTERGGLIVADNTQFTKSQFPPSPYESHSHHGQLPGMIPSSCCCRRGRDGRWPTKISAPLSPYVSHILIMGNCLGWCRRAVAVDEDAPDDGQPRFQLAVVYETTKRVGIAIRAGRPRTAIGRPCTGTTTRALALSG